MNKTPRFAAGTGMPSTSAALSDRADVPSEYFARATAPTSASTRIAVVGPSNPSALTTLNARPTAAATAITTARTRRRPTLVRATQTAARNTTSNARPVSTRSGSSAPIAREATTTPTTRTIDAMAATRRPMAGLALPDPMATA